ncbi:MAG: S9 family peptidase [Chloroflexota bacterium]
MTLDLASLLRTPCVEAYNGFAFSPDGSKLAFSWNHSGRWELYELALDSLEPPRRLTGGEGAKVAPQYAPGGGQLVYALDLDGSEAFDLWQLDLHSGAAVCLTPGTPFALQPNFSFSPDGRRLALLADRDGRFDAYILELGQAERRSPGTPALRKVFAGGGPNWDIHWSPDGRRLAVTAEGHGQDYETWLVDPEGAAAAQPVALEGQPVNAREACWSPDGRRLAFSSDATGSYQVGVFDLADGSLAWLTEGAGDHSAPDWSADGEQLAYLVSDGPDSWIEVRRFAGQAGERLAAGGLRRQVQAGVYYAPTFSPDGRRLACVFDNPRHPSDLWLLDLDAPADGSARLGAGAADRLEAGDRAGDFRQLTRSLPETLERQEFVMPEHIHYPSLDGQSVPALLYRPAGAADAAAGGAGAGGLPPALIVVHGGPTWLFQYLWYPLMTFAASRGWVVLAPNYRGSSGYGRAWQYANRFELGRGDAMDIAAGADYLAAHGLADPARIAVTGRSHGGYLTMCCLTGYPERFAGGSAVVPFLNWFSSHTASRPDLQHWDIQNMGDPVTEAARWRERSPFFYLERIQAPVQLICGANDPRCPASESLAARDALEALGKPVELLLYPDEGHAFLKTENVIDHELRRAAFLAQVLES